MSATTSRPVPATFLFCPGNRPERFDKARASGAPAVILDLEDAVPPPDKAQARDHALRWLAAAPATGPQLALRVNDLFTREGLDDVHALAHCERAPDDLVLVVPKVGAGRDLRWLRAQLAPRFPAWRFVALVETVEGLRNLASIVEEGAPAALGFGAADLGAELGVTQDWEALLFARSQMVVAAAARGLPLLDVPELDIRDEARLRQQCARARAIGFTGKFAIHPAQVAAIVEGFAPSADEVDRAQRVRDAFLAAGGNACAVDGRMVDVPVYNAALRVLARAGHPERH